MFDQTFLALAAIACSLLPLVSSQAVSSWPHDYPGKPKGDFGPNWQEYFQVTKPLPNVTWPLNRNWAGNIPVNRAGHPNDTLFFWAFENQNGSFTAPAHENNEKPWAIWLNGGPGSSSMVGLLLEHGPIHIASNYSAYDNSQFSWLQLADYVYIDQPVGTGWATADHTGYVHDEDQMGTDFLNFLENFVKVFPSLKTRPLYLTGESYAGTYIPYITKAYFQHPNPPVNLVTIAIGDGTIGSGQTFELLPVTTMIETYPQLIGYDPEVFEYFKEQEHLCGYDLNLTYPQDGHFPDIQFIGGKGSGFTSQRTDKKHITSKRELLAEAHARYASVDKRSLADIHERRDLGKRSLVGRANGTIDPWYGCDVYDEIIDYAVNFTFPWNVTGENGFDVYNIPDGLSPEAPADAGIFLNDLRTRTAMHAPLSKIWVESIEYPFEGNPFDEDPSVEPMAFLDDLAANATAHGVKIVIYSGNDDSLVSHRGSEVVIQNTTFGGIQGFSRRPSTAWYDDAGDFAGIVHQERNWSYVLIAGAGHLVAEQQPLRALSFVREFVFGDNTTGLVQTGVDGQVTVVGGENHTLAAAALPGQLGIYFGSVTTQGTYTAPSATIAAWESFIYSATVTSPP